MIETDVLERTLAVALRTGGDFAEVFAEDRRSSSALLDDGKVEELTSGRDRGAGIRVVVGDTTGFAYTAEDREALTTSFQDLLDKLERSTIAGEPVRAELFGLLLWPALLLLLGDVILRNTRLRRFP